MDCCVLCTVLALAPSPSTWAPASASYRCGVKPHLQPRPGPPPITVTCHRHHNDQSSLIILNYGSLLQICCVYLSKFQLFLIKRILNFYNDYWNVPLHTLLLPNLLNGVFLLDFYELYDDEFCVARLAEQTGVIHFFLWCATCGIRLSSLANQNLTNRTENVQLFRPIFNTKFKEQ